MKAQKQVASSKTVWYSIAVAALGILEATDLTNVVTGENAGTILTILAIITFLLRIVTNKPVGAKTVNPDKPTPGGKG